MNAFKKYLAENPNTDIFTALRIAREVYNLPKIEATAAYNEFAATISR